MRNILYRFGCVVVVIFLTTFAFAQADQLKQLTADLQKNPSDRALRERIIKLALETKPAPALPRVAIEAEGAAKYFANEAKSESDFLKAAAGYETASTLAPWSAADYYNAAILYEKGKKPDKALLNYELYLLAAPSATDTDEVIGKIGAMKAVAREADEKRRQQDEQQRQAAAAAEREYQRTAALRAFRSVVEGKSYRIYVCGLDQQNSTRGCTWDEYNGKNFRESWASWNRGDRAVWEFDVDAGYLKYVYTDSSRSPSYEVKVVANGPRREDLRWFVADLRFDSDRSKYRVWLPLNFIRLGGSGGDEMTIGLMSSGFDPAANPKERRFYRLYRP